MAGKIRLGCVRCLRSDFDGVDTIPDDWIEVRRVRSYRQACTPVRSGSGSTNTSSTSLSLVVSGSRCSPVCLTADSVALRSDLLAFPGIGPETADCILTYACDSHARIVVDASARRIFHRLGIALPSDKRCWSNDSYDHIQQVLHDHVLSRLPLYNDFPLTNSAPREVALARDVHALIVELGRHHCTKHNPRCGVAGGPGWEDYELCETHCEHSGCRRCPRPILAQR